MARQEGIVVRVLGWNLFHGRDFPPERSLFTLRSRIFATSERGETHVQVNRPLLAEFAAVLAREQWDVALLQEAPPRWLAPLCAATGGSGLSLLTSRNEPRRIRERLAELNPDLVASNEGGSNQILFRPPWRFTGRRSRMTVAWRPERRRVLGAELEHARGARLRVANMHLTAGDPPRAAAELARALAAARPGPAVLGGDLNVRPFQAPALYEGLGPVPGPKAIDHLFGVGLDVVEPPRALPPECRELPEDGLRLRLSDHAPVVAAFRLK